ncbi:hypothetical protein JTE90_000388, partial [Oedothorax gibbosus]
MGSPVEHHFLELRAHLYQARSLPSLYPTRSPRCFARVFVGNHSKSTQVKSTVNPIWDETLQFTGIIVYGDMKVVAESPPTVVIEVVDENNSLLGRAIIDSIRVDKDFRHLPKLQWFQLNKNESEGQLLAAFELALDHTHATEAEEDYDDNEWMVTPIPPEIRPRFSLHRIEVLFWGLREMQRVHWRHVTRPRIDVECAGRVLQSCVVPDYRRHSNFTTSSAFMDI